jgi:hypothetical protein
MLMHCQKLHLTGAVSVKLKFDCVKPEGPTYIFLSVQYSNQATTMATLVNKLQALQDGGDAIIIESFAALEAARESLAFTNWGPNDAIRNAFNVEYGWGRLYQIVARKLDGQLLLFYRSAAPCG